MCMDDMHEHATQGYLESKELVLRFPGLKHCSFTGTGRCLYGAGKR
jgi:hypothetical protein